MGTTSTPAHTATDSSLHTFGIITYTTKTRPLRTDRSYKGTQNPSRETPLVTLDADHLKPRGPHPLQRIQHRDPSLHTAGIITYYQNTPPTYGQKLRRTPKSLKGDSTSHPECRSPQTMGTTRTSADTA